MRNRKFFTKSDITLKGHPLGYITDGNPSESDPRSVRECNNIDFEKDYDRRRDPYSLYSDLSAVLPSGYAIDNYIVKSFVNKDNTFTELIIVVATKSSNPTKIYCNKYYNPGNNYGNGQNSTTGWITGWTELTENYTLNFTGAISTASGTSAVTAPLAIPVDYFRGWFIYDPNNSNCLGFITKSTAAASAASSTLTIRMNPYYNSGGGSIDLRSISTLTDYIISRFPVNIKHAWSSVSNVSIQDSYNVIRIASPEQRIIWIGLINDRNYFNQSSPIGSTDARYYTAWWGLWMSFDTPSISNKKIYERKYYTVAGTVISFIQSDILELGGIVSYRILTTTGAQSTVKIASLAVSLDGYQPVFLKNLMIDKDSTGHSSNTSIWNYINMIWTLEFDRRLTDLHLFYGKRSDFESINSSDENTINEIFQTSRMENNAGGAVNFTDKPRNSGEYDFAKNAYLTSWINYDLINYGYDWNDVGDYDYANGAILNEYLNANYFSDIVVRCRMLIKIGNLFMAIGLKDKLNQIAITNIINGDVETESIYSDERYFMATGGEELVGGAATQQNQFLLFSKKECIVCELIDPVKNVVAVSDRVRKGCVNKKAIISARLGAEIQGVFWSGYDSKYFFVNNEISDLLENRWRDEYQALSTVIKEAITAGYYKSRNEVFFVINGKSYIWCLYKNNWKIYTYGDVPLTFNTDPSGELLFNISNKLYITEKVGTTQWKDKGTVAVDWRYLQVLNNGSNNVHKILKKIDVSDITRTKDSIGVDSGIILRAGSNNTGTTADIISEETVTAKSAFTTNNLTAVRSNFYFFEIKSGTTNPENDKTLRINEINLKSKLVRKKLQKA